ncbi:MAG: glycine--tRNA ligase subunit beta [bacterium]|nr:glycine--tRNA ligase subunit beta [bacterium]
MENNLLLEIGTEEIPAKLLQRGMESLKTKSADILLNHRISYTNITVYGTPRRLILLINGLSGGQDDILSELRGPAKNIAFDPSGKITEAGQRFADKCGVKTNKLVVKDFKNNDYVFAIKKIKGQKTKKILPEILLQIIRSLVFPKQMRWEETNFKFVRPIRWITALLNDKIVKISLASISSSRLSYGHRLKGNKPVLITDALNYKAIIEKEMVVIDPKERKDIIIKQLNALTQNLNVNAKIVFDEELLDHVTNLVEYPNALVGSFDEAYLQLPSQVLITVMKEQQKYFALEDNNKKLLPNFVVVTNSLKESRDTIRQGNEWVFRARLYDANFFWNEDRKDPLENRLNDLNGIVFQYKLGTILDKVERIKKLSTDISGILALNLPADKISRSADLCKIDLLTEMVKEFPTLQGIMGKEYFLAQKGDPEIAEAIYEHYLPRFSNDALPETGLGSVLSISDKIDNIASFFLLGKIPTGSEDPFALRRQANGILHIIWRKNYNISLSALIKKSYTLLSDKLSKTSIELDIINFFLQRFRNLLLEEGIKYDCIDAVLAGGFDNPLLDKKRAKTMMDIYAESDFKEIATSFSRVTNILKNISPSFDINQELLTETAEIELYRKFLAIKEDFTGQIYKYEYHSAYNKLKPLREPIDKFFTDVLVMDKNKEIQQNRLNLLYNIASMFYKIADFSKIVI